MENDLLSNFDINGIDKKLPEKNSQMALAILIFSVAYFLFESLYWLDTLMNADRSKHTRNHFFYLYQATPVILFAEMVLIIISNNYFYNAFKYQSQAFDNGDAESLNKSIKFFNKALAICIISFSITFLRMFLRYIYYQ